MFDRSKHVPLIERQICCLHRTDEQACAKAQYTETKADETETETKAKAKTGTNKSAQNWWKGRCENCHSTAPIASTTRPVNTPFSHLHCCNPIAPSRQGYVHHGSFFNVHEGKEEERKEENVQSHSNDQISTLNQLQRMIKEKEHQCCAFHKTAMKQHKDCDANKKCNPQLTHYDEKRPSLYVSIENERDKKIEEHKDRPTNPALWMLLEPPLPAKQTAIDQDAAGNLQTSRMPDVSAPVEKIPASSQNTNRLDINPIVFITINTLRCPADNNTLLREKEKSMYIKYTK
ncbi:hypothetical protein RFI_02748 [Reticulomyxa filosa]|uniref:Uncharacterized protein n=1 Tax=Reticulomyxa filosa TaxID=46433 RepID=X6P838_RETFI|nr:hypothetical protein RFI_02748 [Reticulomyxa filosa]|eukprot:ETO34346.1 hypothetical protein RFI_02748 [Reticulomyxa filosa]